MNEDTSRQGSKYIGLVLRRNLEFVGVFFFIKFKTCPIVPLKGHYPMKDIE